MEVRSLLGAIRKCLEPPGSGPGGFLIEPEAPGSFPRALVAWWESFRAFSGLLYCKGQHPERLKP
ncbi:MAG: hypothetical protein A3H27_00240 [Acidobacteria bacterium RIFCSPLOWO2_02_FULL_59_13]|nr:MAG: hypothetical protein A3H27_00240 [Acidobacteria bacterium RIFCSPLOWO2_02_FULL_59_13]